MKALPTDFCLVLEDGQDEIPGHLAVKGVIAAVAQDDPRAKEVTNEGGR